MLAITTAVLDVNNSPMALDKATITKVKAKIHTGPAGLGGLVNTATTTHLTALLAAKQAAD